MIRVCAMLQQALHHPDNFWGRRVDSLHLLCGVRVLSNRLLVLCGRDVIRCLTITCLGLTTCCWQSLPTQLVDGCRGGYDNLL
jgi:hypothetical protein